MFSKHLYFLTYFLLASTFFACHANIQAISKALNSLKDNLVTLKEILQPQIMYPSSIWAKVKNNEKLGVTAKRKTFTDDCKKPEVIAENKKIPPKTSSTLRIMTYNVYMGHKALDVLGIEPKNTHAMKAIIKELDPDILMLEEADENDFRDLKETGLKEYDYCFQGLFGGFFEPTDAFYGNMLLWKKALKPTETKKVIYQHNKYQNRCYIAATFALPSGKKLLFYGTHLDVYDHTDEIRAKQVKEVLDDAKKSAVPNIIYTGDFNAVREKDYDYDKKTWPLVKSEYEAYAKTPLKTIALDRLRDNGFDDCFGIKKMQGPKFTVWTGTVVDFIFLKKDTWNLPIKGCYVYYSAASDHLPLIMDIGLE